MGTVVNRKDIAMNKTSYLVITGLVIGALIGSAAAGERKGGRRIRRNRLGAERGEPPAAVSERPSAATAERPARETSPAARPDSVASRWAEVLQRFDKDGDGRLNEEERAAARAAWQAQGAERPEMLHGQLVRRFDKDGDGKLNDEERKAAWEEFQKREGPRADEFRARILQRFDKDGDGKLNEEERAAAEAAMREMREHRGRHGEGRNASDTAPADAPKVGPTI